MNRATGSATISFGLVSIQVKLHLANSEKHTEFKQISPKGNLTKQKIVDAITNEEISYQDLLKGYEYEKGKFVTLTKEEYNSLQLKADTLDIIEFVSVSSFDSIHVEKSFYLAPDKSDRAYKLLYLALQKNNSVAVGQYISRGKDHLVIIKPYQHGLIMQQMYYGNEMRSFDDTCKSVDISDNELELASKLVKDLSNTKLDPNKYSDKFNEKVQAFVQQKLSVPKKASASLHDLVSILKASIKQVPMEKPRRGRPKKVVAFS